MEPLKNLKEGLGEGGGISTMRIVVLGTAVVFIPAFTLVWSWTSLLAGMLLEIPTGVLWILAILLTGKVGQKVVEVVASLKKA